MLALWRLQLSRVAMAAGVGLTVAVSVIGPLRYGAWQSWWLCYQFLATAFFLFEVRKQSTSAAWKEATEA